jgi:hypothetical protein
MYALFSRYCTNDAILFGGELYVFCFSMRSDYIYKLISYYNNIIKNTIVSFFEETTFNVINYYNDVLYPNNGTLYERNNNNNNLAF